MKQRFRLIAATLFAFTAGAAFSAPVVVAPAGATQKAPARASAVSLPNSEQWDLRASGSGREYRVFVAWPARPAPPAGYRVLYVMDGNAMFFTAVEAVRASERRPDSQPDALTVVVGVGYPAGVDVNVARTLDLTFPGSEPRLRAPGGGADAFLDFLQKDLSAQLARRFTIDSRHQSIFGHSFGGLFVLHALATRPAAFQTYIAASPSIWYAGEAIKKQLAALGDQRDGPVHGARAATDLAIRVLLTAGEYEQVLSPAARHRPDAERAAADLKSRAQVDNGRQVAATLNAFAGIEAEFVEFPGEDHGSVIPAAIGRGVRFMLGD